MLSAKNIGNLKAVDLPVVRQKGSTPIIVFDITDKEKDEFDKTTGLDIFRKYDKETYTKYELYVPHCWKIDTSSKCL